MQSYESRKRSVGMVIILTLVTCGIYHLFWIYDVTRQLNEVDEDFTNSPGLVVLLSIITCGLYTIYWWYSISNKFEAVQVQTNCQVADNNKILFIILSIFGFGIISTAIFQSDLNRFWQELSVGDDY